MKTIIYILSMLLCVSATPFKFKVQSDNAGTSNNDQFTLPILAPYTYNFDIDWGDGGAPQTVTTNTPITHTFSGGAGEYEIEITENVAAGFPTMRFSNGGDKLKVTEITQWGTNQWTRWEQLFWGCSNLKITATDHATAVTSSITNADHAFRGAGIDSFPSFDLTGLIAMSNMFNGCTNMQKFRAPTVTAGQITSVTNTWYNCTALDSFPAMDLSGVSSFYETWRGCTGLTIFGAVNMSGATSLTTTFYGNTALCCYPTTTFDNVTVATNTWYGCVNIEDTFDIAMPAVINLFRCWYNNKKMQAFTLDSLQAASWIEDAWYGCENLTEFPTIVDAVKNADRAWMACSSLTGPITINMPICTTLRFTYRLCTEIDSFLTFTTPVCTDFHETFVECTSMVYLDTNADFSNGTDFEWCFHHTPNWNNVPAYDFSSAELCQYMFGSMGSVSSFKSHDFPAATDMSNFLYEGTLTSLDYSSILDSLAENNVNTSVTLSGGSSKYLYKYMDERAVLTSDRSWTITDGGLDSDSGDVTLDSIGLSQLILYGDYSTIDSVYVDGAKATIDGSSTDSILLTPAAPIMWSDSLYTFSLYSGINAIDTGLYFYNMRIDTLNGIYTHRDSSLVFICDALPDSADEPFAKINALTLPLTRWADDTVKGTVPSDAPAGKYSNPWVGYVEDTDTIAIDTFSSHIRVLVPQIISGGSN